MTSDIDDFKITKILPKKSKLEDKNNLYRQLRKQYQCFTYESFKIKIDEDEIKIVFNFSLDEEFFFHPTLRIPLSEKLLRKFDPQELEIFVFNIGMIELISYWKAACPQKIMIKPFHLSDEKIKWWKKIYFHGLGEFFYLNGISNSEDDFVDIVSSSDKTTDLISREVNEKVMVPIGGGKDSIVTLELLKSDFSIIPLILNPREASLGTIKVGGFKNDDAFLVYRTIDPQLLELNKKGYLNGHTPFSALLAFVSVLSAYLTGSGYIALSNESSANEPTDLISGVNHQYSKSLEFEADFRSYVKKYIWPDVNYFSFLRPLSEFQIASLFSQFTNYHQVFRSCNVGSKTDSWCGSCPKCLFTYIILMPFLDRKVINNIFDKDLLMDTGLTYTFNQLTGALPVKPFECIGTNHEVNMALSYYISKSDFDLPVLLKNYVESDLYKQTEVGNISDSIGYLEEPHFLLEKFKKVLKSVLS